MMMKLDELADAASQNGYEIYWYGGASRVEIERLEAALGTTLPPSFASFLETYGGGGVVSADISGIEANDAALAGRGTVLGDTLECRNAWALPAGLVVIYYHDDEICWCLDGRSPKALEWPVVSFDVFSRRVSKPVAKTFAEFVSTHLALYAAPG